MKVEQTTGGMMPAETNGDLRRSDAGFRSIPDENDGPKDSTGGINMG